MGNPTELFNWRRVVKNHYEVQYIIIRLLATEQSFALVVGTPPKEDLYTLWLTDEANEYLKGVDYV